MVSARTRQAGWTSTPAVGMAFGLVYNQTKPNQTNPVRIWTAKILFGLVWVLSNPVSYVLFHYPQRIGIDKNKYLNGVLRYLERYVHSIVKYIDNFLWAQVWFGFHRFGLVFAD
jgi:hypothetical protein